MERRWYDAGRKNGLCGDAWRAVAGEQQQEGTKKADAGSRELLLLLSIQSCCSMFCFAAAEATPCL